MKCGIFLHSKKQNYGYGKLIVVIPNNLLNWECKNRDKFTLVKMLKRLEKWNIDIYFVDKFNVYKELINPKILIQTKAETFGIESNNSRQRHWFARFRRKTCVVLRSLLMVDLTMILYAEFWVNGVFEGVTLFS